MCGHGSQRVARPDRKEQCVIPTILTDEAEPVNIVYVGEGGTAKTTDIMSAAKLGKVWVANAESGVKARALRQRGIPVENIEIFPGPGEELTYDGLEKEWKRIREALHKDPDAYFAVGWDSITEIQQTMKDNEVARSALKAQRAGRDRDPFQVDQDNWRTINEQCRSLIRKFRDLPCHFVASALEKRDKDNGGNVIFLPQVTPGLQSDLIGWMDIVCYTSVMHVAGYEDDQVFVGLFRNDGKRQAKDRLSATPARLPFPTFDRVLQYVDGAFDYKDFATDPERVLLKDRLEGEAEAAPKVAMDALV